MNIDVPEAYVPQTPESLPGLLGGVAAIRGLLGGTPDMWAVEEVGDGNLNLVFKVRGPSGGIAVKQALPYVRLVGESWPLPLTRAHFEHLALVRQARHAPGLTPAVIHYDADMALIAMELLEPHIIMRHGMIDGVVYPLFAEALSTFAASTLFHTSDLAMAAADKKALVANFAGNTALCGITEDLIFTEPYMIAENNRWTSPQLDGLAASIRADSDLKIAVSRLKVKFMSSTEAMIHGDLHTGSIMVTQTDTRIIDPEFAFVGPMGFDTGAVIANLLLNYFSQIGHEKPPGARDSYRNWVLGSVEEFWNGFCSRFLALWRSEGKGDAYPAALFDDAISGIHLAREQERYMAGLFRDTLGFAAAKMIRRILGLAHNIDLENIADADVRAVAEARSLMMARSLMTGPGNFASIEDVTTAARQWNAIDPFGAKA
ncbi:MAG: S-methyl-5-thioribose kinase [bacterium]|nr:S-methyl-5-thioribose kinase [bacterium]